MSKSRHGLRAFVLVFPERMIYFRSPSLQLTSDRDLGDIYRVDSPPGPWVDIFLRHIVLIPYLTEFYLYLPVSCLNLYLSTQCRPLWLLVNALAPSSRSTVRKPHCKARPTQTWLFTSRNLVWHPFRMSSVPRWSVTNVLIFTSCCQSSTRVSRHLFSSEHATQGPRGQTHQYVPHLQRPFLQPSSNFL